MLRFQQDAGVPSNGPARPSAVAEELAFALLRTMQPDDARDLLALLDYSLAEPTARERRHSKLGLLIRLIAATGTLPGDDEYDRAHAAATKNGERWPDRSSLRRSYGDYKKAREAAARFLARGTASRVPDTYRHATNKPPQHAYRQVNEDTLDGDLSGVWTLRRVADALIAFRDDQGDWPVSEWEYLRWSARKRRLARETGQPPPLYPERKNLLQLGCFDEMLAFAKVVSGDG